MRESKHTPGPWAVVVTSDGTGDPKMHDVWQTARECQPNGHHIAEVDRYQQEAPANARLIAAAPEMLEALYGARGWFKDIGHPDDEPVCLDILRAIRKATGE